MCIIKLLITLVVTLVILNPLIIAVLYYLESLNISIKDESESAKHHVLLWAIDPGVPEVQIIGMFIFMGQLQVWFNTLHYFNKGKDGCIKFANDSFILSLDYDSVVSARKEKEIAASLCLDNPGCIYADPGTFVSVYKDQELKLVVWKFEEGKFYHFKQDLSPAEIYEVNFDYVIPISINSYDKTYEKKITKMYVLGNGDSYDNYLQPLSDDGFNSTLIDGPSIQYDDPTAKFKYCSVVDFNNDFFLLFSRTEKRIEQFEYNGRLRSKYKTTGTQVYGFKLGNLIKEYTYEQIFELEEPEGFIRWPFFRTPNIFITIGLGLLSIIFIVGVIVQENPVQKERFSKYIATSAVFSSWKRKAFRSSAVNSSTAPKTQWAPSYAGSSVAPGSSVAGNRLLLNSAAKNPNYSSSASRTSSVASSTVKGGSVVSSTTRNKVLFGSAAGGKNMFSNYKGGSSAVSKRR